MLLVVAKQPSKNYSLDIHPYLSLVSYFIYLKKMKGMHLSKEKTFLHKTKIKRVIINSMVLIITDVHCIQKP